VITVARKPLTGTVALNVLEHGTGGLNVDACRLGSTEDYRNRAGWGVRHTPGAMAYMGNHQTRPWVVNAIAEGRPVKEAEPHSGGRWPSNVILTAVSAVVLDHQCGDRPAGFRVNPSTNKTTWFGATDGTHVEGVRGYADVGGASRFFKVVPCE